MRNFCALIIVVSLFIRGVCSSLPNASAAQEADVKTQEIVGTILSQNPESSSFDLEYETEEIPQQKHTLTFFVTDISTIDIAMSQGTLADLKPGLRVLVEFAPMPDGTNVVESVWVKK
ncbi:MAG: hypothetical protein JNN05_08125 [Candidatus Omnitrophica bacterium]|nr:hypothetical protein [Candidatus Omnitrophota bacterium]